MNHVGTEPVNIRSPKIRKRTRWEIPKGYVGLDKRSTASCVEENPEVQMDLSLIRMNSLSAGGDVVQSNDGQGKKPQRVETQGGYQHKRPANLRAYARDLRRGAKP